MRRSALTALALFALALVLVAGPSLFASPSTSDVAPETESEPEPELIALEGSDSGFWPYLNSRHSFEQRSPINVVVRGEPEEIVRLLVEDGEGNWEETDPEDEEAGPDAGSVFEENVTDDADNGTATIEVGSTEIRWTRAAGATRYAYVDSDGGDGGRWVDETLQLHDGEYYGQRHHIRLYGSPSPGDQWVAMQTHTEHFDWFTLRHRVDGVEAAQSRLEKDFMALPQVDEREDVSRVYLGNEGPSDANGWATFVDLVGLALAPVLVGLAAGAPARERIANGVEARLTESDRRRIAAARERVDPRHLLLVGTILAIVLGVRMGGIALERRAGFLSMHAIAALLYPFVGVVLPVVTYWIARGLERRLDAAVVASTALATAIWLDYGLLGVDSLPIDVVLQRMLVVVALGLIAGGGARRATRDTRLNVMLVAGATAWVLVLVGTLFGYF